MSHPERSEGDMIWVMPPSLAQGDSLVTATVSLCLGRLNPPRHVFRGLELGGRGADGLSQAALADQRFGHPVAEVVAGALGEDPPADQPCGGAHASREIAQPEPEPALIQVGLAVSYTHLTLPTIYSV